MHDIENELQLLINLFKEIFKPSKPKSFGSRNIGVQGVCDGNFGIQWNVWVDYKDESAMIGVNLEGMQYYDWPISKFILREIENPLLFEVIKKIQAPQKINVIFQRDAWQYNSRPPIKERTILPPTYLNKLTSLGWKQSLNEALSCLDKKRGYKGRANQVVTLPNRGKVEMHVSPHLFFAKRLWSKLFLSVAEKEKEMIKSREALLPIYDFVKEQSS